MPIEDSSSAQPTVQSAERRFPSLRGMIVDRPRSSTQMRPAGILKGMKTHSTATVLLIAALVLVPSFASANHKAYVGKTIIDSSDPHIKGTDDGCDQIHYHGTLNDVADPDIHGCGHGVVEVIPHGDGDGETIPPPLPKGPSFPARVWNWLGSKFSSEAKETVGNVVDVAAEANGILPPGQTAELVDIVKDATPSIMENADTAEKYYDTYTDENEPDRDRYTLEGENVENKTSFYKWFWGLFE